MACSASVSKLLRRYSRRKDFLPDFFSSEIEEHLKKLEWIVSYISLSMNSGRGKNRMRCKLKLYIFIGVILFSV